VVRQFLDAGLEFFVSTSFSKSFSLYGERVGALSVVCGSKDEAARVLSQLKIFIRTNYSNPPTHGAQVVATVLTTPALRAQWESRARRMRERIKRCAARWSSNCGRRRQRASSIHRPPERHVQLFGLSAAQMQRLRTEFGVYGVDSGRICVAALNDGNLSYVAKSIAAVSA
jgi:aromatic-amino-acid transaminase